MSWTMTSIDTFIRNIFGKTTPGPIGLKLTWYYRKSKKWDSAKTKLYSETGLTRESLTCVDLWKMIREPVLQTIEEIENFSMWDVGSPAIIKLATNGWSTLDWNLFAQVADESVFYARETDTEYGLERLVLWFTLKGISNRIVADVDSHLVHGFWNLIDQAYI